MDASQPVTPNVETLGDSEMSQSQNQRVDTPPAEEEPSVSSALSALEPPPESKPKKLKGPPKAQPSVDRPPGKSLLPLTRVQKIMKADKELPTCAKEAVFLISVATEEFIKRLGQAGQQQAMRDKRSTVQRKDVVTAVRRADEFVFLEEILSAGVPAPPAALGKRKQKATGNANETMNIKDAFGKDKGKAAEDADNGAVAGAEARDSDDDQGNLSDYATERRDSLPASPQNQETEHQEEDGDSMDIS